MKRALGAIFGIILSTAAHAQYRTPAVNSPLFPSTPSSGKVPIASGSTTADWGFLGIGNISGLGTGVATALGNGTNTAGGVLAPSAALTLNGVVYGGGSGASPGSTVAGTNNQALMGSTGVAPSFRALLSADLPANGVTNSILAQMTANTVKCNPTGSTANAQDCTNPVIVSVNTGPTADGAVLTDQNGSKTASQIYSPIVPANYFFYGTTRSVLDLESGTTVQGGAAFDAYTFNNIAQGTAPNQKNAVGLFVVGVDAINGASTWGLNSSCDDNTTNGLATLSGRKCIGYEIDFTANGASTFEGLSLIMQGPGTPAVANGVQISISSGSTAKWTNGFIVDNGAIASGGFGAIFGATATSGTNISSVPIQLSIFDSSGVAHGLNVSALPLVANSGLSILDNTLANGIVLETGPTGTGPAIFAQGTDTDINLVLAGKGTGSVVLSGIPTSGTATASICINAAGQLFKKTTTGACL